MHNQVDMAIIDHGGKVEGEVFSAHLKRIGKVKILLLAKEEISDGHASGPDLVLRKPFDPERLLEVVVRMIEQM